MDKKVTSIICYITIVGWLIAFLAGDKEGAKFHLNQALVIILGQLICSVLSCIPVLGILFGIVSFVLFIFAIIGIINAVQDKEAELPIIGGIKILK